MRTTGYRYNLEIRKLYGMTDLGDQRDEWNGGTGSEANTGEIGKLLPLKHWWELWEMKREF